MSSLLVLIAIIALINGQTENDYQSLVDLPVPITEAITAIYGDTLYVLGGKTDSSTYNTKLYKLSLANKFTLTGTNDDVTFSLSVNDWTETTIAPPSYGANTDGSFVCEGQCSVVIGKYLYIVGAYSSSGIATTDNVYRFDLSTESFAAESDFLSSTGYDLPADQQCVTAANSKMYIITGRVTGSDYSNETVQYDPSTDTQTSLGQISAYNAAYNEAGRRLAGCAPNVGNTAIYLFGGAVIDPSRIGAAGVDEYNIQTDRWTSNQITEMWDTNNGRDTRRAIRCLTSLYGNRIECAGGARTQPQSNSIIYSPTSSTSGSEVYTNLEVGVQSAGFEQYEIFNDGTNAAALMIIIGGSKFQNDGINIDFVPTNTTQYAVRYAAITGAPSASPVPSPTMATTNPSNSPSRSPLCAGCTFPPTESPTTAMPTESSVDGGGDSGAVQITAVLSFVLVFLSVISMIII